MRLILLLLLLPLLVLTVLNCDNSEYPDRHQAFKTFDFSYNDVFSTCFSIKFTKGDNVFIRQHFTSFFSDKLKSNTTYYALLNIPDREKVDSFINNINFSKFDTSYFEDYQDGIEYKFYIDKDTITKSLYVHSHEVPEELEKLSQWIVQTKVKLILIAHDTVIHFGSIERFLPPEIPAPHIKFTPPKLE